MPAAFAERMPLAESSTATACSGSTPSRRVADSPAADDAENLVAIRRFNDHVAADARVANYLLPIADGLTLIVKL